MNRRQFITRSAYGLGAAWLGTGTLDAAPWRFLPFRKSSPPPTR